MNLQERKIRHRRITSEINVVPYIDVMLVLLVIFMVAAPLMPQGVVKVPEVKKTPSLQENSQIIPIKITMLSEGVLTSSTVVQGKMTELAKERLPLQQETTLKQLMNTDVVKKTLLFQQKNPQAPIVIAAEKSLSYNVVMTMMNALYSVGAVNVGLVVKQ